MSYLQECINISNSRNEIRIKWLHFMLQINCLWSVPLINNANVYIIINQGNKKLLSIKVVAKEIVAQLRFSLNQSPLFPRDLVSSIFGHSLNARQPGFVLTRWEMQYKERKPDTSSQNKFHFNYLTRYSSTNTKGSQELIPNFSLSNVV